MDGFQGFGMFDHLADLELREQRAGRPYRVRERKDPLSHYDDIEFKARFRLSKERVRQLVQLIEPDIKEESDANNALSPSMQVLLALRFLATGTFQRMLGDEVGVARTTVGRKVHKCIQAIAALRPRFIRFPESRQEIAETKRSFHEIAGFPGVISVVDGTHVRIQCPSGPNGELYRNRKGFHSLNVQATCDASYRFTSVVARWPGSTHDARIWDNSGVQQKAQDHFLQHRGLILGDAGYACTNSLLTPLREGQARTQAEKEYNKAHKKTRCIIERSFGILKKKFPCLSLGLRFNPTRCGNTVVAAMVIYNMALEGGDIDPDEEDGQVEELVGVDDVGDVPDRGSTRQSLIEGHFSQV